VFAARTASSRLETPAAPPPASVPFETPDAALARADGLFAALFFRKLKPPHGSEAA
jgi:hypothetical protein